MANITKTDPVDNIGSVLANICASSPSRMINWIFRELIDFIATSDDNVALFEFGFHIIFYCALYQDVCRLKWWLSGYRQDSMICLEDLTKRTKSS